MKQFIVEHWVSIMLGSLYLFTAVVSALPQPGDPRPLSQKLYQWLYDCLHILSNRAIEKKPNLAIVKPPQPIQNQPPV